MGSVLAASALALLGCSELDTDDAGVDSDAGVVADAGGERDAGMVSGMDSGMEMDGGAPDTDGGADAGGCMTGEFGASTFGSACFGE
jgi:hypothetical protein